MNLLLRAARLEDIPTLQSVERDADTRFGVGGDVIPEADARRVIDAGKITVAEVGGELVGWVYLLRRAVGSAWRRGPPLRVTTRPPPRSRGEGFNDR